MKEETGYGYRKDEAGTGAMIELLKKFT